MILNRMIAGLHGRILLAVLGVLVVLAVVLDFFEQARFLVSGKGSIEDIALLLLYRLPSWLYMLLPVALVTSSCIVFAMLGSSGQLRALASAGISPLRLVFPLLLVTLPVLLGMLLLQEWLIPPALDRMEPLMLSSFGRIDSTWRFFHYHLWHQGEGNRLFRIRVRSPDGRTMERVTIVELDPGFHLMRRIDVTAMDWERDHWEGRGVEIREFDQGRLVSLRTADQERIAVSERPERFRDLSGRPSQKRLGELADNIEEMQRRGLKVTEYRLAWHNRFSYPLVGGGLVLFAFPWLVVPWRRRTLSGALTESMALSFVGYFLVTIGTAAVSGGLLSAPCGAWLPVVVVVVALVPSWFQLARSGRARGRP